MPKIKTKEEALNALQNLDEKVLIRIAELCDNKKALSYFKSTIRFAAVKAYLNS